MTETAQELTLRDGGCWRVVTQHSVHFFDLDRGTVERVPGSLSQPTINDRERPLRTLDTCRVGECGRWTMKNDGYQDPNEFYWHITSEIVEIVRVTDRDNAVP